MLDWFSRRAKPAQRRVQMLLIALLAASWLAPEQASAGRPGRYCFLLFDVQLADGLPDGFDALVRTRFTRAIADHERLLGALPEGAPDPRKAPKAFRAFVKKRRITPYRVNAEVVSYSHEVEPNPRTGGKRLTVNVALRVFGETMPARTMAFSGEGSATVKLDIGKRLRARDSEIAQQDALDQAVADALRTSIQRLDESSGKQRGAKGEKKK